MGTLVVAHRAKVAATPPVASCCYSWVVDQRSFVDAYLDRIGAARPARADRAALQSLQAAHVQRVPFENLSVHLGETIHLEPDALADKILRRRRGGFCYELNGLFAQLLGALGFEVTLQAARVWSGEQFGPPMAHLALRVQSPDDPTAWLVDVGFGALSLFPIRLVAGPEQQDPAGRFEVTATGDGDWDVRRDGVVQYRLESHPRALTDFTAMCWYQQHAPLSHFTQTLVCTIQTPQGRITLSGNRLIETEGEAKRETHLGSDQAVLDAYRASFGIELDQVPHLTQVPHVSTS